MREKSPRFADAFTAEAVTLNLSKCHNAFAHLLSAGIHSFHSLLPMLCYLPPAATFEIALRDIGYSNSKTCNAA